MEDVILEVVSDFSHHHYLTVVPTPEHIEEPELQRSILDTATRQRQDGTVITRQAALEAVLSYEWKTRRLIAQEAGLSRESVRRGLRLMIELGIAIRSERPQRTGKDAQSVHYRRMRITGPQ